MDNIKFKPTTEWMKKWYDHYNSELFGGYLGDCKLGLFTTGKGSQGSTLGHFRLAGRGNKLRYEKHNRRLYEMSYYNGKTYVNASNFVEICNPHIELNGNYSGTEQSLLSTLVHEMCHYYTYMYGYVPKQAHGREFREIAETVSYRSNGKFTVQRLATAEDMQGYELDAEMQAKRDKRVENKKTRAIVCLVVVDDELRLILTTNFDLVEDIAKISANGKFIGYNQNADLVEYLFNHGYKSMMRTYRYWSITKPERIDELLKYNYDQLGGSCNSLAEALGREEIPQQQSEEETSTEVETNEHNGYTIINDGDGYNLMDNKGNKTFAKPVSKIWYDNNEEVFYFTMGKYKFKGQPGKWQKIETVSETKKQPNRSFIREAIEEILEKRMTDGDGDFEILPDMNLSDFSPFESTQS